MRRLDFTDKPSHLEMVINFSDNIGASSKSPDTDDQMRNLNNEAEPSIYFLKAKVLDDYLEKTKHTNG